MRIRPSTAVLGGFVALGALAAATVVAGPASAYPGGDSTPVTGCGQTLTEGAHHLTGDLACDGVGFTVPVGVVTLDLAGYTLDGGGSGTAFELQLDPDAPESGTFTLTGGRVSGWSTGFHGAWIGRPWNLRLDSCELAETDLVFDGNNWGGAVALDGCWLHDNNEVFILGDTSLLEVVDSVLERNASIARSIGDYSGVVFLRSTVADNELFADYGGQSTLVVQESTVSGADLALDGEKWTTFHVLDSTFVDNRVAIDMGTHGGDVHGNLFERNGTAFTASPGAGGPWDGPADLLDNTFRDNGDAIVLRPGAEVELGRNVVLRNAGWGIYAPGAVDLGGNVAYGNGRSPQCTGVVCTRPRS